MAQRDVRCTPETLRAVENRSHVYVESEAPAGCRLIGPVAADVFNAISWMENLPAREFLNFSKDAWGARPDGTHRRMRTNVMDMFRTNDDIVRFAKVYDNMIQQRYNDRMRIWTETKERRDNRAREFVVLVCGSTCFSNKDLMKQKLDEVVAVPVAGGFSIHIIIGDLNGAEALAQSYAFNAGYSRTCYHAEKENLDSSYKIRNSQMIIDSDPDVVVAFAGPSMRQAEYIVSTANRMSLRGVTRVCRTVVIRENIGIGPREGRRVAAAVQVATFVPTPDIQSVTPPTESLVMSDTERQDIPLVDSMRARRNGARNDKRSAGAPKCVGLTQQLGKNGVDVEGVRAVGLGVVEAILPDNKRRRVSKEDESIVVHAF